MSLSDQQLQSIVPDATLESFVASIKYGKTRKNGGLNVADLRSILQALDSKTSHGQITKLQRKQLEETLGNFLPADTINNISIPISKKPSIQIYTAEKSDYIPSAEEINKYLISMYPHVFQLCDFPSVVTDLKNSIKVMKHMELMRSQLLDSLSWSSCFLLRMSETNISSYQFMICGPSDTPYDNGFFHFSMDLPRDYPSHPPNVQILNTFNGKYRANPNLYANGKVCLSLLGTWRGPGWDPSNSTLAQVLLAIQTSILNEYPIRNEPAYENTPTDNITLYNAIIRIQTIRVGMIHMIKNPPSGFEEAITAFFSGPKKAEIANQMRRWVDSAKNLQIECNVYTSFVKSYQTLIPHDLFTKKHIVDQTVIAANELLTLLDMPLVMNMY